MSSVNIPSEQWAQIIEQPQGPIVYKKIPVPAPGPDEVLVHVQFSGVCHTDLHALRGDWPLQRKTPLVGGHEGAGVVVAKGQLVTNIDLGSRVGIKWLNGSCLNCSFCLQGDEQLCPHAQLSGYTVDGTFQQYAVAKANHVTHIPPGCNLAEAAPILCAGVTVYRGLKEACVSSGQIVAIVGAGGGLGCLALQYAKAMGVRTIAVDAGEDKARTCRQLGAETFVDFARCGDLGAALRAATPDGFGPHAVLLIAAKEEPFHQASRYVRPHGTVVCIGIPGNAHVEAPVFDTVIRMVNVKGSYIGNRKDAAEAIDFFQRGLIKEPYKLIGLSQLQEAYDQLLGSSVVGRYVVDTSK